MSELLVHCEDQVLTLTFNRLPRRNALTGALYAELADTLARAEADPGVRALVLQGHESVFSAGSDLADYLAHPPLTLQAPIYRFARALATFAKPLLAAVCGPAVGMGAALLLHCDLVCAGDNAALALPAVHLGLPPEAGASWLLPELIGPRRAAQMLLLGEPVQAEAALELGLVNRLTPPAECHALTQSLARRLTARADAGLLAAKALLRGGPRQAVLLERIDEEARQTIALLQEPATQQALRALA